MKTSFRLLVVGGLLAAGVAGCDLLDPSNVKNPDVLEDDFLGFPNPTTAWLRGMERQLSLALNNQSASVESSYIATAEIASDNYVNTSTYFNQFMDELVIDYRDDDIDMALGELADLRETAEFGLTTVVARDAAETPTELAELHFFKGMAHLLTGEIYHLAPADSGAAPVPSDEQFRLAVAAFTEALNRTEDATRRAGYHIALARTYRNLGDRAGARAQAAAAIDANPDYLRFAGYDDINNPTNDMQFAIYGRPQNDLQPLPRLDFLDPKFFNEAVPNTGDDQSADVAYLKGEEAYLILAEVQLAENDVAGARATMKELLDVVAARARRDLLVDPDPRTGRPRTADWRVAAAPDAPLVAGLVLQRNAANEIPVVSGTSVTAADVDAQASVDDALALLYLLRQEIFFGEGRRMMDLGIKWPVSQDETLLNEHIADGDPATLPVIPDFLPAAEMDAYDADATARTITIRHDLNRLLVQHKASPLVLPFF